MEVFDNTEVNRSHDRLYLDVPASSPPKEAFTQTAGLLEDLLGEGLEGKSILDAGCAVGHFPNYLQERFPAAQIEGLEYLSDLVQQGAQLFPDVKIREGSILEPLDSEGIPYDAITMLGVLQIFDDVLPILSNMAGWLKKPGGLLLIHGLFNPFEFDLFTRYRKAGLSEESPLENGWNVLSQKTFRQICEKVGASSVKFHEFQLPFDLEPKADDPLRSWTEVDKQGKRHIINGLNIRQPQYVAEVLFD